MAQIIKKIENMLKTAGITEYQAEAKYIIKEVSNLKIEDILLKDKLDCESEIIEIAEKRIKTRLPLQYIFGYSYFMGEKYEVNNSVLIPRDETEFLVLEGYERLKDKKNKIDILDIGVGSGCISCALAKKLKDKDIEILAVDISLNAIKTALKNAIDLNLEKKIVFRKSDLFSKIRDFEKFDLIISNPPYIPKKLKNSIQDEVKFEPEGALFTTDDKGIEFYEKIINDAPKYLKDEGVLAFELGINESGDVSKLLEKDFKDIKIIKDLAKIDRVISAVKK